MRRRKLVAFLMVSPVLAAGVAVQAGFRFNHTESMPVGIYRTVMWPAKAGDLVTFRAPELAVARGYVSPNEPMLKRLAASAGDAVSIDPAGVTVNGRRIPHTEPLPRDLEGLPLPALHLQDYRLQAGEVLPLSDYSPLSFDGRYFGPISRSQIQSVVVPVWTW